jgi:hypothetical protein
MRQTKVPKFYSKLKSLRIHNGFSRSTWYSITYPAATLKLWYRIQIWNDNTEPQHAVLPVHPKKKARKTRKSPIQQAVENWLIYSAGTKRICHPGREFTSTYHSVGRTGETNSFLSCYGLDPGIISYHILRKIYRTSFWCILAAIGTPASTAWKVRRLWMTNRRGNDRGLIVALPQNFIDGTEETNEGSQTGYS